MPTFTMKKILDLGNGRRRGGEKGEWTDIYGALERTVRSLLGRNILWRDPKSISRWCLFCRGDGDSGAESNTRYCDLDGHTRCAGETEFCKNPNALKEYFSRRGLAWKGTRDKRRKRVEPKKQESPNNSWPCLLIEYLYGLPAPILISVAFLMSILIGFLNLFAGPELSSSVLYMVPISLATWFTGGRMGILASVFCALTWLASDLTSQTVFSCPNIPYWNVLGRFSSFLVFTIILAELKKVLEHEKESSRVDALTGVRNRRFFIELADQEIKRALKSKSPFCTVYIDLDNFKAVNDSLGHSAGDNLLKLVASVIQNNIRATDTVARLGGDEFAILLPDIGPELAEVIAQRVQRVNLDVMAKHEWPVTLSMGVVAFTRPPSTTDELLRISDTMMYKAKKNGKNTISYEVWGEEKPLAPSPELPPLYGSRRGTLDRGLRQISLG